MSRKRIIRAADLFCGAGGTSTGLELACKKLGLQLDLLAINHWDTAIETHSANHPKAAHLCMNVDQVDPRKAVPSGKLDLLIASPECTHHSVARGGRPINDQSRASAWLVLRWAEALDIKNILIENVPEFRTWGPLGTNGRPLKSKKGKTFLAFINALESLGYAVKYQILNAADFGDPTTRKRLFILARKGRRAVVFPDPTHTPTGHSDLFRKTKRWRAAREIIDWKLQGESIFNRKKPLSPNTMRRIYAGLQKFSGAAFVMATGGPTGQMSPRSVEEPLRTVLTDHRLNVFQPFVVSLRGTSQDAVKSSQRSVDEPVPTITGGNHQYLAEPFILNVRGGDDGYLRGAPIDAPVQTITTQPALALIEPFVIGQQSGADAPTAKGLLVKLADGSLAILDIRFRMLNPRELAAAMSFPKSYKFAGNREQVVKQIGNAVAVKTAEALCLSLLD